MRTEEDAYGAVEIPDGALYGVQTVRCLQNLSCSPYRLSSFPELIRSLALVKKAAAQANQGAAVIPSSIAGLIGNACDRIIAGEFNEQFPVDMLHGGGSIAFNQNINEVVANLANIAAGGNAGEYSPVHPKQHVNASQSTADACSTAFRLAIMDLSGALIDAGGSCAKSLSGKSEQYKGTKTIARTCLQDAMPVEAASLFMGWSALVERRADRFGASVKALGSVNLGGTVIGGGDGAPETYRRKVIGILGSLSGKTIRQRENLYDAAQNIDDLGEVSLSLELLAQSIMKVAQDLRLLSSGPRNGFGELSLPAVQDGSSFFKGKVNPVVPETVLQACFHVVGSQRAAMAAIEHGELNLNVFESGAVFHILESIKILTGALQQLNVRCLSGLSLNVERCAQMVSDYSDDQEKLVGASS